MSLIKHKAPPGKSSWLNRFLSDIMNLQNPSSFARDAWGKISSATKGKVYQEGESLHLIWLGASQTFRPAPGDWDEIPAECWEGEEQGQGSSHLSIRPGHQHSSPLCPRRSVQVAASLLPSASTAQPHQLPQAALAPQPHGKAIRGQPCAQGGVASQHRREARGFFQHSDPVFSVTQLCGVHKDDTGCALLAVRLMFGNKKTDGFICLIIWCC